MKKNFITTISFFLFFTTLVFAQKEKKGFTTENLFQTDYFIENKGQFEFIQKHVTGVKYALLNNEDEIYFTDKGISFRVTNLEINKEYEIEEREMKRNGKNESEEEEELREANKYKRKEAWVDMQWLGANNNVSIESDQISKHYFSYGDAQYKSYGFKKITYKNLYNNIDLVYEVHPQKGIEYTLLVKPGADLSMVRFKYSDNAKLVPYKNGLKIKNGVSDLIETNLKAFYENGDAVSINYEVLDNEVALVSKMPIDNSKTLIIDPWVSSITTLTGATNANNKGHEIDFDIQGNLLVYGGGGGVNNSTTLPKVAKYDPAGNLLWTFNGIVVSITWYSNVISNYAGNFAAEKISGKIYISQGFNTSTGNKMIRINQNGIYDNFVTTSSSNFQEIWDMKFNCATGQIIALGGGTNSTINFGLVDTTTGAVTISNVTGLAGTHQDIVHSALNSSGEIFLMFNSNSTSSVNNYLYKINNTFSAPLWNLPCGYSVLSYVSNKAYASLASVGFNCIHANNTKLFYYDGFNLKAFNQANGATLGTPITITGQTAKLQAGIYSNDCDEVYIGNNNGGINKYIFNGTTFVANGVLSFAGQTGKKVYDITFNPINNLLYVSGEGFVGTIDPNSPCPVASVGSINLSSTITCPDSAVVTIINPTVGLSYTFIWQDSTTGTTLVNTQQPTGVVSHGMSGLVGGTTYKVTVIQSTACQVVSNVIYINVICPITSNTVYLCPGSSYTFANGSTTSTPGIYNDTLTSSLGVDSVVILTIANYSLSNIVLNASICPGQSYTLPNGTTTINAGTFTQVFTDIHGCDSTVTVNLTINPTNATTNNVAICPSGTYTLPSGVVVSNAGTYTSSFTTINGCDSIITTNISLLPTTSSTSNVNICSGNSYTLPSGVVVTAAGTYTSTITGSNGCDSVITTTVNTLATSNSNNNISICPNSTYTLPSGIVVSAAGIYTSVLNNSAGCDSIITTTVSILNTSSSSQSVSICPGSSYTLPSGIIVTNTGVYTSTFIGSNGCDSIVTTNLFFKTTSNTPVSISICQGDTFTLPNGIVVNNAGTYISTFTNVQGCDSIITTTITYKNYTTSITNANICSNQNYILPTGIIVNTPGQYIDTVNNAFGCDSIITTNLTVVTLPTLFLGNDTTICKDDIITLDATYSNPLASYIWNDNSIAPIRTIDVAGSYIANIILPPCPIVSDTFTLLLKDCSCKISLPNAFTPNDDDKNDKFKPLFSCIVAPEDYIMRIYNRWGQEIFATQFWDEAWDGNYRVIKQEIGTYFYSISFINPFTRKKEFYKGDISLIR